MKVFIATSLFLIAAAVLILPYIFSSRYAAPVKALTEATSTPPVLEATHLPTPLSVKGIYMTACVASLQSWRESLKELIDTTELNSVVIDIKDYTGTVSFKDPNLESRGGDGCQVKDMREFIEELHKNNIYVVGRVAVFQDPLTTSLHPEWAVKSKATGGVWKDRKGLSFVDVNATSYWDWIVALAKDSYNLGFDEVNFDYIRYPSDGNLEDADFTLTSASSTKAETLEGFFKYLHQELSGTGLKTSADLFGLVTVARDDLGIGQVLERALPYFDYISPMVYPSHFAPGTDGYTNPAANPYEIINFSMKSALERASTTPEKLRPWLQDFDLGASYGPTEVRAQIQALQDLGLTSWLLWDAGNKYTPAALLSQ